LNGGKIFPISRFPEFCNKLGISFAPEKHSPLPKTSIILVLFVSIGCFASAQDVRGDAYLTEVTRIRKAATRQIELRLDTCDQYPDSTRFYLWFVLTPSDGAGTALKVISEHTKGQVSFSIYPHQPLDVNWKVIGVNGQSVCLIIPASMGCPDAPVGGAENIPLIPSYLPDQIDGFWNRQIHVLKPIWSQLSYRSH
jgi:hypothetical protein